MPLRRPWMEILLWVPVGLVPITNGALRIFLYGNWIGEPQASVVSSALDVTVVSAYACLAERRWPVETWGGAVCRGCLWLAMTTLNHFGLGFWLFGMSLQTLVAKYYLHKGEMWSLVSLGVAVAPAFGRWKTRGAGRSAALTN